MDSSSFLKKCKQNLANTNRCINKYLTIQDFEGVLVFTNKKSIGEESINTKVVVKQWLEYWHIYYFIVIFILRSLKNSYVSTPDMISLHPQFKKSFGEFGDLTKDFRKSILLKVVATPKHLVKQKVGRGKFSSAQNF